MASIPESSIFKHPTENAIIIIHHDCENLDKFIPQVTELLKISKSFRKQVLELIIDNNK